MERGSPPANPRERKHPSVRLSTRLAHRRRGALRGEPTPFLLAPAETGGLEAARAAIRDPVVVYAHARARGAPRRWHHLLGRFAGFALLPTAVLFNAHQHIAYGGLVGEYYLLGLGS